jgi:hypothetical protein
MAALRAPLFRLINTQNGALRAPAGSWQHTEISAKNLTFGEKNQRKCYSFS